MELELIYSEMAYEEARHIMQLRHIDCIKTEEDLKHFKRLSELKEQKESLLKSRDKKCSYIPQRLMTEMAY
jgi:hypothetical protein